MPHVWIVIVEDRHADVEVLPCSDEELAIAVAREQVSGLAHHPEYIEEIELTPEMRADGWVFNVVYSAESDCVRVVKRTVDDRE